MNRRTIAWLALLVVCFLAPQTWAAVYTFTNIADTNTPAPIGTFEDFFGTAISGNTVAFRGRYVNPDNLNLETGIFTGIGGPLTTIAKTGNSLPLGTFEFQWSDPSISGSIVAFKSNYRSTDGLSFGNGIFTGNGGPITTIAKQGDAAPPGTLSSELGGPSISVDAVAFRAGFHNDKKGILLSNGGQLTSIVTTGDSAPTGTFGFGQFAEDPAVSNGIVAFRGVYPGGTAIFSGSGGALTTIIKTGDAAPSGVFTTLGIPSISGNIVAFGGAYTGGTGIFMANGGSLTTIVEVGDAAPSGTFSSVGTPSISGNNVAFVGTYAGFSQRGIFIGSGGPLTSVIETGDSLFGSTVNGLGFGRFGLNIDGSGSLAFGYSLADGRTGIARADVVPEPSTSALLFIAAASLMVRKRQRIARGLTDGLHC